MSVGVEDAEVGDLRYPWNWQGQRDWRSLAEFFDLDHPLLAEANRAQLPEWRLGGAGTRPPGAEKSKERILREAAQLRAGDTAASASLALDGDTDALDPDAWDNYARKGPASSHVHASSLALPISVPADFYAAQHNRQWQEVDRIVEALEKEGMPMDRRRVARALVTPSEVPLPLSQSTRRRRPKASAHSNMMQSLPLQDEPARGGELRSKPSMQTEMERMEREMEEAIWRDMPEDLGCASESEFSVLDGLTQDGSEEEEREHTGELGSSSEDDLAEDEVLHVELGEDVVLDMEAGSRGLASGEDFLASDASSEDASCGASASSTELSASRGEQNSEAEAEEGAADEETAGEEREESDPSSAEASFTAREDGEAAVGAKADLSAETAELSAETAETGAGLATGPTAEESTDQQPDGLLAADEGAPATTEDVQ
jgi:hypothetical protein